ncbi:MAG: hypothetical protein WBD31_28350 [Rubripirellula sp.]
MKNSADDLESRRPVWEAMSELYLDTELDADDLNRIGRILRSSPYNEAELDCIMFDEVFPVLIPNMWGVAGQWAGFDLDWLQAAILQRQQRRLKIPNAMILGRWMVRDHWRTVKGIAAADAEQSPTTT